MAKRNSSGKPREYIGSVTLKDCDVQTFRVGGHGGQNVNKVETGVRIIHRASGAKGEGREFNSQHRNKVAAFRRMAETKEFLLWVRFQAIKRRGGLTPEEIVDKMMSPQNLITEIQVNGRWVKVEVK